MNSGRSFLEYESSYFYLQTKGLIMIDISFLRSPVTPQIKMGGLEFLDWQKNTTFFQDLSNILKDAFDPEENVFLLTKGVRDEISKTIRIHANINATIISEGWGNLAVDTGYLNPGNLLNTKGIDDWFDKKYSKFAEAFKDLKTNVIEGWCDPKTGRVEGKFSKIPFSIYINPDWSACMDEEQLLKLGVTHYEAYAAFILHECGHVFSGLYFVSQTVIDNVLMTKAAKMYSNASEEVEKVKVIKEASEALDINKEDIGSDLSEESVVVYFSKQVQNRNHRRSLSVGVTEMTSEVLADAYAIRHGAGKALVAGISSFPMLTIKQILIITAIVGAVTSLVTVMPFLFTFPMLSIFMIIANSGERLLPGVYDTDYRRMKTSLRELITKINASNGPDKQKIIKDCIAIEKVIDEHKPFFESTAMQRTLGWLSNGSDFRKQDFEHYTAELASSTLAIYTSGYFQKG